MLRPLEILKNDVDPTYFLGNFRREPLGLFSRIFREQGDFGRDRLFRLQIRYAFHPTDIQRVLVDNVGNYSKDTRGYHQLRALLGNGLITSEGDFWIRQRRIAQPAFARRRIAGFARTMVECTDTLLDRWASAAAHGDQVDLSGAMMGLTLRIAGLTMLSVDLEGEAAEMGDDLNTLLKCFNDNIGSPIPYRWRLPFPSNRRASKALERLDIVANRSIDRRHAGEDKEDLLQMLFEAVDEKTGERMTNLQLRDEVMTLFLAGHETTANALNWTFTLLARHPEILRKVEAELEDILGDAPLDAMTVQKLNYLDCVIKESMRVLPPVWAIGRRAKKDDILNGERIEAGTVVILSPYITHRHPDFWENADSFEPDRFLGETNRPRFAYFPFSGGPRQCIGKHFAEMELLLIVAAVLRRYRLSLVDGDSIIPEASVTLRPKNGIRATLTKR